jgi:hypothetical protein
MIKMMVGIVVIVCFYVGFGHHSDPSTDVLFLGIGSVLLYVHGSMK